MAGKPRQDGLAGGRRWLSQPVVEMARRVVQVLAGVLLGLVTVAAVLLFRGPPEGPAVPEPIEPDPYPAEDFTLTAHDGRDVSLSDFEGQVVVLFFGFSHCPDVCPATLLNLSAALERIGEKREEVQGLLVTVDPERDTPERLREYMGAFDPSLLALTGSIRDIEEVADAYGVFFRRVEGAEHEHASGAAAEGEHDGPPAAAAAPSDAPGEYRVEHTARTFLIDQRGRVAQSMAPVGSPEEMESAILDVLNDR